jgi:hypothetical protein
MDNKDLNTSPEVERRKLIDDKNESTHRESDD